jgi:hypothetical protein
MMHLADVYYADVSCCRYEHIILWHRLRLNNEMYELCKTIARSDTAGLLNKPSPVVVVCCYGRRQETGYGTAMFLNACAMEMLRFPHGLLEGQSDIFLNGEQRDALEAEGKMDLPKKVGELYRNPATGKLLIYTRHTMGSGFKKGDKFNYSVQNGVLEMPNSRFFRVQTALSLIQKAWEKADAQVKADKELFIISVGKTLFREGLTIKTRDHELPPTCLVCSDAGDTFDEMPSITAIQGLGRVCGIRSERYNKAPVTLVCKEVKGIFEKMAKFNEDNTETLSLKLMQNPNMTLGAAMRSMNRPSSVLPNRVGPHALQLGPTIEYFGRINEQLTILEAHHKFRDQVRGFASGETARILVSNIVYYMRAEDDDEDPTLVLNCDEILECLKKRNAQFLNYISEPTVQRIYNEIWGNSVSASKINGDFVLRQSIDAEEIKGLHHLHPLTDEFDMEQDEYPVVICVESHSKKRLGLCATRSFDPRVVLHCTCPELRHTPPQMTISTRDLKECDFCHWHCHIPCVCDESVRYAIEFECPNCVAWKAANPQLGKRRDASLPQSLRWSSRLAASS